MDHENQNQEYQQEPAKHMQEETRAEIMKQEQVGEDRPYNSQKPKQNNMSLASMVVGIIGIVTSCCCYLGIIFGSLGIIFALLSKTENRFSSYAVAGMITSSVSLALSLLMLVFYFIILGGMAL